jgi:hypothetical protein
MKGLPKLRQPEPLGRLGKRKECFTWHTHAQYVG